MSSGAQYRVKGSVFRAHVKVLEREQRLEAVRARLSPATARLVQSPPLASSWMDSPPLDELLEQVELLDGMDGIRRLSEDLLHLEMSGLLVPMVRGVIRVIGPSPHRLYGRFGDLVRTVIQGAEFTWTRLSEKSGIEVIRYPSSRNVPMRTFITSVPPLNYVLFLCNVEGTVEDPVRRDANTAEYAVSWK